ncbi:copper amine oxidase N-terminal domain-containing protein [Desulfallas sp. Bu1-1]|uniref:stalk domain-containing protein n=1 Tax=Desulfallas sp. Bu1-1 TaxID=2787620 RepID=UPI0018A1133A|nr:stalk domain-containing protein [Desulfallas sp. Bu1-1]MBF7082401.1 copper amine oxidase N-terminal domain-containing protein [Desulfallas sp. Bu1-1]
MRRFLAFVGFILALALLTINLPYITHASADEQVNVYDEQKNLVKSVVFVLGLDQYFVNGKTPGVKMDAKPFVEQGRTFVPVRYLSNALGVTDEHVGWESPRVTLDEPGFPVVELSVGSKTIRSNGKSIAMDVSSQVKWGRTHLPARWVAEALGYQVEWLPEHNIVLCWPKGTERPDISDVVAHIKGEVPVTPPVQQPSGEVIDLTGKGESITKYPWAKYLTPEYKINWLTYEEFNSNVYQLGEERYGALKTYGMRVTKDDVYFTLEGGCGRVLLYEGGDVLRVRESSGPTDDKYEYGYSVVNDRRDKYSNWPTADITKVSHIFLDWADTILAVENPLYQGGNK